MSEDWPALPWASWSDTCATLQLWTQIVGKIRLAQAPMVNHWWQVPLYVTARGLTTSPVPFGARAVQFDFDFIDHDLILACSDGASTRLPLKPQPVAEFYRSLMARLEALGLAVKIWTMPCEIPDAIAFDKDFTHSAYDAEAANRFWRILFQVARVFHEFRGRFIGKVSPVHFFWGSFDLAVTRFSGRVAPPHPGSAPNMANRVMREAYSHEVSSCGFWPGGPGMPGPAFYSYAYPNPPGFGEAKIGPAGAAWNQDFGEFLLPYDTIRGDPKIDAKLLEFLQTTYAAAADLGKWDRAALER